MIAVLLFCLFPVTGDLINTVSGNNRVLLSLICIIIVIGVYKIEIMNPQNIVGKLFELFGMATYGIYLLHPVVNPVVAHFLKHGFNNFERTIVSVLFTTCLALLSYYKFERPLIKYGKKIVGKW